MVTAMLAALPAAAGPQHWGFGFGYLVTIEENERGERALSVYEPPLRVKDGDWLLRWRDTSDQYQDVLPNGVAVGDFWPEPMGGREHVVVVTYTEDAGLSVAALDPPEVFGTRPWGRAGEWRSRPLPPDSPQRRFGDRWQPPLGLLVGGNRVLAVAAGNVMNRGRDQLIVLAADGRTPPNYALQMYAPPEGPGAGSWTICGLAALKGLLREPQEAPRALVAADFWGRGGRDALLLVFDERAVFFDLADTGVRTPAAERGPGQAEPPPELAVARPEVLAELPLAAAGLAAPRRPGDWLAAADFLKDGFAYLAWGGGCGRSGDPAAMVFTTAPKAEQRFSTCWVRPDETFAGAKLAGQQVGESRRIMVGARQAPFGSVIAAGAGRTFGYVTAGVDERKEKLWKPWQYHGYDDAEIAFAHRTPVYRLGVPKEWQDGDWPWEPDEHYGWPLKDEEVAYEVSIKNNGREPIPPGAVTLRAWVAAPERNADVLRPGSPDFEHTIGEPIPPFDPARPEYAVVRVALRWPFELEQPPGWTWKRINVRRTGERWLILRLEYAGDENERNDRYELALNSLLFRPVWRFDVDAPPHPTPDGLEGRPDRRINTLAYRAPVVVGDPESKEYNGRKLADAVQCMWERSRTSGGEDVWQRVVFDSYRLFDPQGRGGLKPLNRADDWSCYEGPREGEHWVGLWGDYERFDPRDGGAELHETGHLFHRIGDLYHYFIFPTAQRSIRLGDGSPVQMHTYAWGLDSFCSGHAIIGEATCDLHRMIEGVRYGLGWGWHRMLPDALAVRVLDRDGRPVPGAPVSLWLYPDNVLHERGVTDGAGVWPLSFPAAPPAEGEGRVGPGERPARRFRVFDPLGIRLYEGRALDSLAQIFTVELPGYSDFMIWGAEDTHAHSRYTLMQQSLLHREGWTWDFRTLYRPGAPEPQFTVTAAVRGREIMLRLAGTAERYRVYRRWEPTYVFEPIAEVAPEGLSSGEAEAPAAALTDDMGAADWYMRGRYRAVYYVTAVSGGVESLPVRVYGIALDRANGLSALGDGRLIVSANCGKADPFGVLCRGTMPVEECIRHFRFGHTAAKIIGAPGNPERFCATLVASDMPWGADRYFDLIRFDKPDRFQRQYPVLQAIAAVDVRAFSTAAPYTVTLAGRDPEASASINAGDWALAGADRARILAVDESGLELTLDRPLFREGQQDGLRLHIEFGGGTPGDRAELRELRNPRGLDTIILDQDVRPGDVLALAGPRQYLAIADTGNGRVVVWDAYLRHAASWQPAEPGFHPAAVARDPSASQRFFVLDRRADRGSRVYLLQFDGRQVRAVHSMPVDVGDGADGTEIGLAAGSNVLAITDASAQRVLIVPQHPETARAPEVLTEAIGTFVGDARLGNPTDVAYAVEDGEVRLYAVDGHDRVVRLR